MLPTQVFQLFLFCIFSPLSSAAPQCKVLPGSQEWPSQTDWEDLNDKVEGNLLRPSAPAAPCHPDQSSYDPAECDRILAGWQDTDWHSNHPTSTMWQNYNDFSCMPNINASCSTAGYPIYVIAAKTAKHVKAGVDFARTKNIRLNIKSSGHCFLGRSVQPNSLSIWTRDLKSQVWFEESFTPQHCNPIKGPAITVGAGSQWGELYEAADERDLMLVGGASDTVSVGGYIGGGGHSSLSPKYGMGADMVLELEAVTADGRVVIANECQNEDLFWALRGGGGSTFAAVLTYTLKAIPSVPVATWSGYIVGWDNIVRLHTKWPALAEAGVGGYLSGYPGRYPYLYLSASMPGAISSFELKDLLEPILHPKLNLNSVVESSNPTQRRRRSTDSTPSGTYSWYSNFRGFRTSPDFAPEARKLTLNRRDTFPGIGMGKLIVSWLWSAEDVAKPGLEDALRGSIDPSVWYLNDLIAGAGTANPPYIRGGGNAVNPAWRTAVMRPASELQWDDPEETVQKKQDGLRFGASLRSLSPDGGTYGNEADPDTANWQYAFWGTNYKRLLGFKQKVDPDGVFHCRRCVGSELWIDDSKGQLCPV
ncbi:FAD-binding domain-containing protein [Eremomyces bilateralis CBS 781.70]|uniref:FAD-binding domain-containing protein n=1 Tax=Eremomyces bilateralis CBS 781.70 TaxID=1392243 RepID=A0A6G1FRW0_9PEZI|nr:FAD-binding domain-containing protein [Eremomyces bilateralis CBS 781.70]KAF1808507.1 FAD-binding domain-containing protein [Eremomyces bilateralis CBS 781.70]